MANFADENDDDNLTVQVQTLQEGSRHNPNLQLGGTFSVIVVVISQTNVLRCSPVV